MRLIHGDCLEVLPTLPEGSIDAVVTDPPYGLEFMGKEWDKLGKGWDIPKQKPEGYIGSDGVRRSKTSMYSQHAPTPRYRTGLEAQQWHQQWATAVLRVLKPGGYMLAFGGSRTYHRLACAVEDAGFEIRDCIMWLYGSGFPKGRGCLKPAHEPILLARKPGKRVLPLGIDECRVGTTEDRSRPPGKAPGTGWSSLEVSSTMHKRGNMSESHPAGRWPANVAHDGSAEVLEAFAEFGERRSSGEFNAIDHGPNDNAKATTFGGGGTPASMYRDTGTAARFFKTCKPTKEELEWLQRELAKGVETNFNLKSDAVVSALTLAVEKSTLQLVLQNQSVQARDMNVSEMQLNLVCESVIETIQNIERRYSLGLPQEKSMAKLGPVMCVATPNLTGIISITISLMTSSRFVEVVTFNTTQDSSEHGERDSAKNRRLYYTAKASRKERGEGNNHPTVKPLALMRWLVRLVARAGETVLDPFGGSGTTGVACIEEGRIPILIEREAAYMDIARKRIAEASASTPLFTEAS
jgi:DNA modification methylase